MAWKPEDEAKLRHLWNEKELSAREIAEEMGVSRNMVIGKARRMGLKSRPSPIKRA